MVVEPVGRPAEPRGDLLHGVRAVGEAAEDPEAERVGNRLDRGQVADAGGRRQLCGRLARRRVVSVGLVDSGAIFDVGSISNIVKLCKTCHSAHLVAQT